MASIVRYSPFDDAFDSLFRGFLARPLSYDGSDEAVPFRVDVTENDNAYTLRAEIPGVKKDDIQITIDGDTVAINAEVKNQKEVKDGDRVLRTERYYGKVYRAFALAQEVDQESAQARYDNGVLELTLPKRAAASTRKLMIQ